jgi:HAD superfamily 5'-nucleotidase-like hydrolase
MAMKLTLVAALCHPVSAFLSTNTPPLGSVSSGSLFRASSLGVDMLNQSNGTSDKFNPLEGMDNSLPGSMFLFPTHSNDAVKEILVETEGLIRKMHKHTKNVDEEKTLSRSTKMTGSEHDAIYANTYVDLGKVDTVGFDYDYTLVTYTEELLELIYDMALKRLVKDRYYPLEMLESGLSFDPHFSIRGLAVDKETGWICHLSYTHKVAVAWDGREKVSTSQIYKEYRGKRALNPKERKSRLKPLNDLFSMVDCCLIADTIQFFKDSGIEFHPSNVVTDILGSIGDTHRSGDFHRIVADDPEKYFNPTPHLEAVLTNLKSAGKQLILASNSPYWYVDAGMKYVLGDDWMKVWDAVIVSAGKPAFYTDVRRPFREVNKNNSRVKFKKVCSLWGCL